MLKARIGAHAYTACNHEGPSTKENGCGCAIDGNFCEKYCACSCDECSNRFEGCSCRGDCQRLSCPCFVAHRECDPDVCDCGSSEASYPPPNPLYRSFPADDVNTEEAAKCLRECCKRKPRKTKVVRVVNGDAMTIVSEKNSDSSSSKGKIPCKNVGLAMGWHVHITVARSKVHGWGAFTLEPVKKGTLIYEYVGEMISQNEADRRGKIYDKGASSFLFNVNETQVIDAARKGNKMKFANDSSSNTNCYSRGMMSCGDHRVGIYAARDIPKGNELFFRYGYSEDDQKNHFEHNGNCRSVAVKTVSVQKRDIPQKQRKCVTTV